MLNLCIKSFVNPFIDIALTFFNVSLIDVTSFSLLSKSDLFTKLAISLWLAKFPCFNFKLEIPAVNLLNSGVVIYLS